MMPLLRANALVKSYPLQAAVTFGMSSKLIIDAVVQRSEQLWDPSSTGVWQYDTRRGISFAAFGAIYLGFCQHAIYSRMFPSILSALAIQSTPARALTQLTLDQLVVFPVIYFPLYYGIQGTVNSDSIDSIVSGFRDGLRSCWANLWEDCLSAWAVWAPVQLANFGLVARHWRAPFVTATGFLWTAYLSSKRGRPPSQ